MQKQPMSQKEMIHVEVSGRIREAREVAGLTQEQFAELIRILPQNVSCAERGG